MTARCHTCDLPMVLDTEYDERKHGDACVRDKPYCTSGDPTDWRTRALKAEGEVERMRPIVEAAEALLAQPVIAKGDDATWGDVAQSHFDGPKLLIALRTAIDAAKESK